MVWSVRGQSSRVGQVPLVWWLLFVVLAPAACDVIFRVPEVMVRHAAASKPVGSVRSNSTRTESERWGSVAGPGPGPESDTLLEVRYEEYFVEHEVSTADARAAAKKLNVEDIPPSRAGCGPCSTRDVQYCESRVLADHCCCERRFVSEPFPWLPHTCYVGAHRCRPLAHDCAQYVRLRNCCCYRKLADRWKGILSKSAQLGVGGVSLLLLSMLLLVTHL